MANTNSSSGKPCSLRLIHQGRALRGTSAQIAFISRQGGWDMFLRQTATEAIETFVETYHSRLGNTPPIRQHLRLVGGED